MSLHDIFMKRAALEHQNALASDTTGIVLQSLAEGVAKGISEEQQRVQKQRDADRALEKSYKMFTSLGDSGTKLKRKMSVDSKGDVTVQFEDRDSEDAFDPVKEAGRLATISGNLASTNSDYAYKLGKEAEMLIESSANRVVQGGIPVSNEEINQEIIGSLIPSKSIDVSGEGAVRKIPRVGYEYSPIIKGRMAGIEQAEKEKIGDLKKLNDRSMAMENFFSDSNLAYSELAKQAPSAGESSIGGAFSRAMEVPFKKMTGEMPYTKALGDRVAKLVYPMAKSYDPGGRLAKDDVEAFANVYGLVGKESIADVATKGALELRDLIQTMNAKGADGEQFLKDFSNRAAKDGGISKMIIDRYNSDVAGNEVNTDDQRAYEEYMNIAGR